MQLGFVSAILPDFSLHEVASTAATLGYDCVELMCWPPGKSERRYAGVTHVDVSNLTPAYVDDVRSVMTLAGIGIAGLGYYPNLLTSNRTEAETCLDHLKKVILAAEKIGVRQVNSFVGRDPALSVDDNWPRFLEVWRPLVKLAEDHGVRIGIENCPMFFSRDEWPGGKNLATTPAIWRRMFHDVASDHFGLNYDPSHMVWQQMDYLRPLREFADKLFHVHAKDVRLDRQRLDDVGILAHPLEYHTPKLPGMGEVDWGRFFSVLGDVGYRGPVCVEVEDRTFEESHADRKAALRQSATFLRNFVPRRDK